MFVWSWWLACNEIKKDKIYPNKYIQSNEGNIYKILEREEIVGAVFK